ncbi:MAG: ASCH domain-containing protein [Pseudomonadales bacterium]|nr:ASCH domain-containing protein [Pseudomonadales bacterium]
MQFAKHLRERVQLGEITCSLRVWMSPRVKVGNRYRMEEGHVVIERIRPMDFEGITPELARRSGFPSVAELLRTAVHGKGRNVYLVEFRYEDC